jgi:hypothetical protein
MSSVRGEREENERLTTWKGTRTSPERRLNRLVMVGEEMPSGWWCGDGVTWKGRWAFELWGELGARER